MDYMCYCGAQLQLAPEGNRWICPQGHQVYACKQCEAMGKSTPLQWIAQYQRWYCYECKQYAPVTRESRGEEIEGYTLEISEGSRIDEFCFECQHLKLTQNDTHVKCELNDPRFLEPAISETTTRPIGSGEGVSALCIKKSMSPPSGQAATNLTNLLAYIQNRVAQQIENHEREAASVEMYRIEFIGGIANEMGAKAVPLPVSRDSLLGGRTTLTVDKANMKVWIDAPKLSGFANGAVKFVKGAAGSIEDRLSVRYLRDLLKRDIQSFERVNIFEGEETQEFLEVIDRDKTESRTEKRKEILKQPVIAGPKIEMYQYKWHVGNWYREYYTGGRSDSETKTITLDPLENSIKELQPKRIVIVVDHQSKIVWFWLGKKSTGWLGPLGISS